MGETVQARTVVVQLQERRDKTWERYERHVATEGYDAPQSQYHLGLWAGFCVALIVLELEDDSEDGS